MKKRNLVSVYWNSEDIKVDGGGILFDHNIDRLKEEMMRSSSFEPLRDAYAEYESRVNSLGLLDEVQQRDIGKYRMQLEESARKIGITYLRIYQACYKDNKLYVSAYARIRESTDAQFIWMLVKSERRLLGETKICTTGKAAFVTVECKCERSEAEKPIEIILLPASYTNRLKDMYAGRFVLKGYVSEEEDAIEEISVEDPRHIKTQPGKPIIVAYNRTSQAGGVVDYDEAYPSDDRHLMLPLNGTFRLNSKYELQSTDYEETTAFLFRGSTNIEYSNNKKQAVTVEKTGNGTYKWSFDKDWKASVPMSVEATSMECAFMMNFSFFDREGKSHYLIVSSLPPALGIAAKNYKKIDPILIYWGCLEEHTKIRMADGSLREIRSLRIGEQISENGGGHSEIEDIIKGWEEELYYITAENGSKIIASIEHPFLTEHGMKSVKDLTDQDRLVMEDGSVSRIIEAYPGKGGAVYNLVLASSGNHTMLAEGFVAGDNILQKETGHKTVRAVHYASDTEERIRIQALKSFTEEIGGEFCL